MKNKVVWITGASSGIGEALAVHLSQSGAKLILSARRENELRRVQKSCTNSETHLILPLDLANPETFPIAVQRAIPLYGHVDILINNGGISQRALAKDTLPAVDRKLIEINYLGTAALTKALLPGMIERQAGHIVVITSLVGKFGTPMRSGYAASKHALHGFFDSLRAEVYADGIAVTIVCPGFVKTNISFNALTAGGTPQNKMDDAQANGISPEKCARKIIRAVKTRKREVYIGGKERYAVYLKRFLPGLFNRIIRTAKVT